LDTSPLLVLVLKGLGLLALAGQLQDLELVLGSKGQLSRDDVTLGTAGALVTGVTGRAAELNRHHSRVLGVEIRLPITGLLTLGTGDLLALPIKGKARQIVGLLIFSRPTGIGREGTDQIQLRLFLAQPDQIGLNIGRINPVFLGPQALGG